MRYRRSININTIISTQVFFVYWNENVKCMLFVIAINIQIKTMILFKYYMSNGRALEEPWIFGKAMFG